MSLTNSAYTELETRSKRVAALGDAMGILGWDQEVMMPDGAAAGRAIQMATLAKIVHEMQTDGAWSELLSTAKGEDLDDWQAANVRELAHDYAHATALPASLVEPMTIARAECGHAWRKARHANDWAAVKPKLETLVKYAREAAKAKSDALELPLYDALLDEYDPGRRTAQVDQLFAELKAELPPLLEKVLAKQAGEPTPIMPQGPFPIEKQQALSLKIMELLKFNFEAGRLDISSHPFSGGASGDNRITTRYNEDDFTSSLMGTIHETGHSQYEAGRPGEWRYQPVGNSRGMTIHESQSLLFEMQAGRSNEFINNIVPLLKSELGGSGEGWDAENLVRLYQKVGRSLIRVDADEITYPLHVMLRYKLERLLMAGDIEVADLPTAWMEEMEGLIGIRPPTDVDGVMQDVHWYEGIFGYFPTYTLGAMTAAQIFAALRKDVPDVMDQIGSGEWAGLLAWLRTNVHGKGCLLSPDDLIESATGGPLTAAPFLAHLKKRYLGEAG